MLVASQLILHDKVLIVMVWSDKTFEISFFPAKVLYRQILNEFVLLFYSLFDLQKPCVLSKLFTGACDLLFIVCA